MGEGLRIYFSTHLLSPSPGFYRFVTLPLDIPEENELSLPEILQSFVTPLGNSKVKNQEPWKFNNMFSWTPLEIFLLF